MAQDQLSARSRRAEIRDNIRTRLIAEPLRSKIDAELSAPDAAVGATGLTGPPTRYEVIIELNLNNPVGRSAIRQAVLDLLGELLKNDPDSESALVRNRPDSIHPYIFATLTAERILDVVTRDEDHARASAPKTLAQPPSLRDTRWIFRVWESQKVHPLTSESIRTVNANAAHNAFGALGDKIVWAVMDSGVDASHPHFQLHDNLTLDGPLKDKSSSFITNLAWDQDAFGHGTHVAGIIAGEADPKSLPQAAIQAEAASGESSFHLQDVPGIKGMAPCAKLLVLRVLDDAGDGDETALIQAIEYVQQLNDYGRDLVVHGVNISAGFPAHPMWYACGQTPLCIEINRLVKSGVVVVVAAGNTGHIITFLGPNQTTEAGQTLTINDPGNADLAITVGSTHRESPHTFGISYFSSKGPTSDGRRKPEIVAPGERIISAASAQKASSTALPGLNGAGFGYIEDTGTSMAAPHVSGVLAAFLSVKSEYKGQPEQIRTLLMQSAVDLGRDQAFQGAGLVDLMKLIQSV